MNADAKRRVAAAASALALYASGCADTTVEPYNASHEHERLDYPQPRSIDNPDSYVVPPPRPTRGRAARGRPARPNPRPHVDGDVWRALAMCESGMRQDAVGGGGRYLSYFQWLPATWRSVGGTGDPRDAPYDVQVALAQRLQARSGWQQWPACARKLGLR